MLVAFAQTSTTDRLQESLDVVASHDLNPMHWPALRPHRDFAKDTIETESHEKRAHSEREVPAARVVTDDRRCGPGFDAAIRGPQVPKERRDAPRALPEDAIRDSLLPRPQAEDAELVEQNGHGIAHAVRQPSRGREVDLVPRALAGDTGSNPVAEDVLGQRGDQAGQLAIPSRVLNRVTRQRAAVADQMSQEREFRVAHRLAFGPGKRARYRNAHAGCQIVEPPPAVKGEKLVVARRADLASEMRSELEHRFAAGRERVRHDPRLETPGLGVDGENAEPRPALELADRPINALVGKIDARVAREAPRLAQVRKDRPLIVSLLDRPRERRQRHDLHVQIAREHLQLARDLRHLLHAVLGALARRHQLEVVDDDQSQVLVLRLEPARLGTDFHHRLRPRVVDVDRRLHQLVARRRQSRPVVLRELARAQPLRLDLALAAHQPLRHFGLRHLEREERDGNVVTYGDVRRGAQRQRGFPHRRAGGDDDQVAGLEAGGDLVPLAEARRYACHLDAGLVQLDDSLEALLQQLLDVGEVARDARLRQLEENLLGLVDKVRRFARSLPAEPSNFGADADQPAERRRLADDARVMRRIRGRRNKCGELVDAVLAARSLELAAFFELVDERDRVDGLAFGIERERRAVDLRVALAVEVAGVEDLADRPDRAGGEHHRPEDGLLGLEALRGDRGGRRVQLGDHYGWAFKTWRERMATA